MNWLTERAKGLLPASRAGRVLVLSALIDSVGTGLYLAAATIYFVRFMHLDVASVGLGLTVAAIAGLVGTVPLGALGDRFGARRLLVWLQFFRCAGFVALAFSGEFWGFLAASVLLSVAAGPVGPLTQAVTAAAVGEADRLDTLSRIRVLRNVGFSVGALIAAPLIAADSAWTYRAVVLGNALSFAVVALVLRTIPVDRSAAPVALKGGRFSALAALSDRSYLTLTGLNGLLSLHTTLLSVGIPLCVVSVTAAPAAIVPVLTTINTIMAVLLQVRLARTTKREGGGRRVMLYAAAALATTCVLLAAAQHQSREPAIVLVVAAMVAMTFGELWQSAGSWDLSYRYAKKERKSLYLSVFSLGFAGQSVLGPVLFTHIVSSGSRTGWLVLAGVFVATGFGVRWITARLETRLGAAESPRLVSVADG